MSGTKALSLLLTTMLLSGCASVAKGVTQAVLESSEEEDTRACHIEGPVSVGLEPSNHSPNRLIIRTKGHEMKWPPAPHGYKKV